MTNDKHDTDNPVAHHQIDYTPPPAPGEDANCCIICGANLQTRDLRIQCPACGFWQCIGCDS